MRKHMTAVGIWSLTSVLGLAQAPTPTSPPIDYAARVQSVENLKQHIAQREERFEFLKKDLLALDARVEKQIDDIVKRLASLKDSQDSKTKVANIKEDVMKALVRTIWLYRQKRVDVFERMRKDSNVPKEELEKTLKTFDDRIGKRVDQIMELAKSFPGHEDVEKYESYGTSYYNGWNQVNSQVSEEWKQNRRASTAGRVARRDLLQELDKAVETNQSRRASIADALANRKLSDKERALQQEELGRLDATIDKLRADRRELVLPDGGGASREIGAGEAHDAEQMLDDARSDLARDFSDIMRKYAELDPERTRIFDLKANLKAREEWLKKNPPPAK
ncbi:MAG: hypothetical protein NTW21_21935 [Verrucomicrobia bacterium]|nr:hypothetical protein [Verrucomicrobiota bacterium]